MILEKLAYRIVQTEVGFCVQLFTGKTALSALEPDNLNRFHSQPAGIINNLNNGPKYRSAIIRL
jgi:hypothetical protein